jgi:hypothetical protein
MSESEQITVYQLKIFILGISPMIWRRFKVHSNSTITDLHYIVQIVMGWTDPQASFAGEASPANVAHLHRFVIHGKDYGIAQKEPSKYHSPFCRRLGVEYTPPILRSIH